MTPVLLELATAQRFARAAQTVEDWPSEAGQGPSGGARLLTSVDGLLYGTAAADYSSGTTISLTPCDANSVDTGENDLDVTIPDDWGTVDLLSATVGGVDAVTVTCKIASGTLLQYAYAGATPYLLGLPPTQALKDWWVDADTLKVVYAVFWLFGTAASTVCETNGSDVMQKDVSTLDDCA
jgi:hypothetical protein